MAGPVIELSALNVRFGKREILKELKIQLSGRVVGLLGPNGARKSTLKFLNVPQKAFQHIGCSGRIPPPITLGISQRPRWSIFVLLDWMAAGCPRR
jgi:ABC-type phosphate transport system ATPase subunit